MTEQTEAATIAELSAELAQASERMSSGVTELRARISSGRDAVTEMEGAPCARSEQLTRATEMVRRAGDAWYRRWAYEAKLRVSSSKYAPDWPGDFSFGALCFAVPDIAQSIAIGLVDRLALSGGVTSDERARALKELRGRLVELETAEERAVDEAIAAGIPLRHRPEVVDRREIEAIERERDERLNADREARHQAIDDRAVASENLTRP